MTALRGHIRLLAEMAIVLCGLAVGSTGASTTDQSVIDRVTAYYELDTSAYKIDVVASSLTNADLLPSQVSVVPLSNKEPIGLFTVIVTADRNGIVLERGQVRLRIRKFAEVVVLTQKVKFHQALAESDVTVQRMEITNLRETALSPDHAPIGYRAKRNLAAGQILTLEAIEPLPVVESGREVAIVVNSGAFSVTAEGIALQDGALGDQIKVKNISSGRILAARVIDDHRVTVGR